MNDVLPLKILGMIGPILCWVERIETPGLPDSWKGKKLTFKDRIHSWLIGDLPTYSYDNLNDIISLARDRRRPGNFPRETRFRNNQGIPSAPPHGFNLVYMFHELASHYFRWTGNELCIREGRMVELHELGIRFPVRHIISYCHADAVAREYISEQNALKLPVKMSQLHTTYKSFRTIINKGLYEGHLHLNGITSADETWAEKLLNHLSPDTMKTKSVPEKKLWVLGYTACRMMAMGMLSSNLDEPEFEPPFDLLVNLDQLYQANPGEEKTARQKLRKNFVSKYKDLQERLKKNITVSHHTRLEELLFLSDPGMYRFYKQEKKYSFQDDLYETIGTRNRIKLLEKLHFMVLRFLIDGDIRLRKQISIDNKNKTYQYQTKKGEKKKLEKNWEYMHQVFTRYLIYNTHHWQMATQSGKTTGLKNFKRFYEADQRELTRNRNREEQGMAVERISQDSSMDSVEGRLSPPYKEGLKYLPWSVALARQIKDNKLSKFGIIVHFIKQDNIDEDPTFGDEETLVLRYGIVRRRTRMAAYKLFRLLSRPNIVTPFIVGIDAANLELTTPPEVFAPAFRFIREFPIKLRSRETTSEKWLKGKEISRLVENRRLGMTYHVGEDFHHIVSGLRAIHEVIEFLKPLPGDRLGHAIALALDPEVWANHLGYQSVLPQQEWLDSLVWLFHWLGPGHDLIGELDIEDQIQLYSRRIYGKTIFGKDIKEENEKEWLPMTLYDSWRLRQVDPYSLDCSHINDNKFHIRQRGQGLEHKRWADVQRRVLKEVDQHVGSQAAYGLVKLFWYGPSVRKEGNKIITIDMKEKKDIWLKVCREAQRKLQEMVRDSQLVIEANPSSNRSIGPMSSLADHPVIRLTLQKDFKLAREIRVTINTDNPGVCSTSLHHEYYLMGEVLLNRGVPETEVVEWLNWLRKNGKNYSFLNVLPFNKDKDMAAVIENLTTKYPELERRLRGTRKKYVSKEKRKNKESLLYDEYKAMKAKLKELSDEVEKLRGRHADPPDKVNQ